jgi:peroxiredoxin
MPAPDFALADTSGRLVRLADFASAPVLVVMFLCNHCPYVRHLRDALAQLGRELPPMGAAVVGICSNDAVAYPADSPERMAIEARDAGWTFPYLHDATQDVARAYRATCTPDFFVYDTKRRLAYRGQFDDSRPGNGRPVTGHDVRAAVQALLSNQPVPQRQVPSIGCNIKWRGVS